MSPLSHSRTLAVRLFAAALVLADAGRGSAEVHYVDMNSTNATPPYTNWTTAATNIQDAVDAAGAGDEVVVTNGTYATGGRAVYGTTTNRVAVNKPLALRSVNGPQFTVIRGSAGSGLFRDTAIRCVYLTNGASLSGFTLTNGFTGQGYATNRESSGGGLQCESTHTVLVSNCVIAGNHAWAAGGGAYQGTLNNCVLSNNSAISPYDVGPYGGGAFGCTLNNCILTGNSASHGSEVPNGPTGLAHGGGAAYCTLSNCTLTGNSATSQEGAGYNNTVDYIVRSTAYGGGAFGCTLTNCALTGNVAKGGYQDPNAYGLFNNIYSTANGGGASASTLINCTLAGNTALASYERSGAATDIVFITAYGGGASDSTLINCTLAGNLAWFELAGRASDSEIDAFGGGASGSSLNNCILTANRALYGDDYDSNSTLNYCCTWQGNNGVGNITNAPLFVDTNGWADLRLQPNSPCINAGSNAYAPTGPDLDGNPRISGGTVDIGAYEFQSPVSMISYAWLQQFNLPINPATDTADPDGDGVKNYHEWLAGTNPTNRLSSPAQLTIIPSGVSPGGIILSWSTNAVGFTLQSTTNLISPAVWTTNSPVPVIIAGQNIVTNPVVGPREYFRLISN